jgi:hypothetical protein
MLTYALLNIKLKAKLWQNVNQTEAYFALMGKLLKIKNLNRVLIKLNINLCLISSQAKS